MALKSPEQDEFNPVRSVGDEHYKQQQKRFEARYHHDRNNPSYQASQENASGDTSDPRGEDLGNQESEAATDSSQRQSRLDDDIGTQEVRGSTFRSHVTEDDSTPTGLKQKLTRKRNVAFILGTIFLGIGLFFAVLLTPALALVSLKEGLLDKFDDRMQTLQDKRNIRLLNKKLTNSPLTSGCKVKVKCRFKGMSNREVKKFEKRNAGAKVKLGRCVLGRCKVNSIEFNDSDGKRKTVQPSEFKSYLKNNREFRAHISRYNKSTVAHFRDKQFGKVAKKLGLFLGKHRSKKPPPGTGTPEERAKAEAERKTAAEADAKAKAAQENKIRSKLGKGVGALAVVCVAHDLIKAAGAVAVAKQLANLIPLAVLFVNGADDIKNGTATGDQGTSNNISEIGEKLVTKDDNGETAFDSFGWQYAAYGVIDKKSEGSAKQFQISAGADEGIITQAAKAAHLDEVLAALKFGLDPVCKIFNNIVAGLVICGLGSALSLGATAAVCAAQGAAGAVLLPILLPKLLKALVKTVSTKDLVGGKAANAAIGGFSALTAINSHARGAYPLKKSQAVEFDKFSDNAQGGGAWVGKDSAYAPDNPLQRFSQKFATNLLPSFSRLSNLSSLPTGLASFAGSSFSSLSSPAQARSVIKGEYDQCKDAGYGSDIATDPFCIPQYGFDPSLTLGDNQFNSSSTADVPASHNPTNSIATVFQSLFGEQTAYAKEFNDTRGFTPDNRFDADGVIDYMHDSRPWITDNGDGIDYSCPEADCNTDYVDYTRNCLENGDLLGKGPADMCQPKDCKNANQGSLVFRFCMFSMYANDSSLNDQYEDNDADLGGEASTDSSSTSDGAVSGDAKKLAQQLLDSSNVTKTFTDSAGTNIKTVLEEIAKTGKGIVDSPDVSFKTVAVNPKMLQALVEYAKDHKIAINCMTNCDHTGPSSNHYKGLAVDFDCNPGLDVAAFNKIASKYGGKNNGEICPGAAHYHYDFLKK